LRILLLNPNKRGYSYTPIWIASHTALLKAYGHKVELFDATFYKNWCTNYYDTLKDNQMYKENDYARYVEYSDVDIYEDLQKTINRFKPDIIFWSAISSHIHSEGEYTSIQNGYELLLKMFLGDTTRLVAGGLQATADHKLIEEVFPRINIIICGESEVALADLANGYVGMNVMRSTIVDLKKLPPYDYSLFDKQVLYRAYNGKVYKAVDYEMSRGCPHTCSYCVESVIQKYYGFNKKTDKGNLMNAKRYFRFKKSETIIEEIKTLYNEFGITYIRCQDTNFLSIPRKTLVEVADGIKDLPVFLYIETRPDTITKNNVDLLKRLKVDGVGMGLEVASAWFRTSNLKRFVDQQKIKNAIKLLTDNGIKSTTYNIIGLEGQTEEMLIDTIKLNRELKPTNVSTSFYSPFMGTPMAEGTKYLFNLDEDYSINVEFTLSKKKLEFYRKYFNVFVKEGLDGLEKLKWLEGIDEP